jgi:hypothetical protein
MPTIATTVGKALPTVLHVYKLLHTVIPACF